MKRSPTVLTASSLSFDCGTSSSVWAGCGSLVNQFVLRLRCAELVEEEFVIVNLRTQFVFLVRLVVAAVEKSAAIFFPRRIRKLDPVENILSILAGLDVAHFPLLPIGAGGRETISHQLGVIGHVHAAHCDCAVFRQHIWIEKLARLFEKVRRGVKNVLVL